MRPQSTVDDFTVGVEEEYQLVDPETGELASRARDVIAIDWGGEIHGEVQETMVEAGTRACRSVHELDAELRRLRLHIASASAARELAPVAAGLHPFSDWRDHERARAERYRHLYERFGRVERTDHVFGMHVHVAVPESTDRIAITNRLRPYVPHLLALSASSPFYEGEDTGYASYRTILAERLPCSGIPPAFASEHRYWSFMEMLVASGATEDLDAIYWSIRPHATYPTIEVRCPDVCPRVDDAVAVAALIRALVVAAAEGELGDAPDDLTGSAADALIRSNEWQAARYGLDAVILDASTRRTLPMREAVESVVDEVAPLAEMLGDDAEFARVSDIVERGNAAERMRAAKAGGGGWPEFLAWLTRETALGIGMDRRRAQRGSRGG